MSIDATVDTLALITARGGSKGLPGKNLRPLGGKPLIVHTVQAALAAHSRPRFHLVCSTDAEDIAACAEAAGAAVPFLRPATLASDTTTSMEVVEHALANVQAPPHGYRYLLLLQPTSPLRRPEHIDDAFAVMDANGPDAVVSVVEAPKPMNLLCRNGSDGRLLPLDETPITRRQDAPKLWAYNGAIYLTQMRTIAAGSFYGTRCLPLVMDKASSVDIDDEVDMALAEVLYARRNR